MSTYYIADAIEQLANNFKEVMDEKNKIEREKLEFEKMKFEKLSLSNSSNSEETSEESNDKLKCKHDWEYKEMYFNPENGDYKYKYVCNNCHEVRMVHNMKELND